MIYMALGEGGDEKGHVQLKDEKDKRCGGSEEEWE
jgi:hypothetical protein